MRKTIPLLLLFIITACSQDVKKTRQATTKRNPDYLTLSGNTMGTTYNITYRDSEHRHFQTDIDGLLEEVNDEVSTYVDNSIISSFNKSSDTFKIPKKSKYFIENFNLAKEVFEKSNGSFDPTVMPLVNYWGFGNKAKRAVTDIDKEEVAYLKQFVGFEKVKLVLDEGDPFVVKSAEMVELDFSACAKGGAVDAVGSFLQSKGISDYLIDIGGELVAHGQSPSGGNWKVGISIPKASAATNEVHTIVKLGNKAIATSGNHRNYYKTKGYKYGHTLNPSTGFPEKNDLLSASVFAPTCMKADAYATAFMVMGLDKAFKLAEEIPEIEAFFIYGKEDGSMEVKYTSGTDTFLQ